MFTDPDFVPFEPPERPLGLLGVRTLLRNYIETIPRFAYKQSVTRIRTRLSDVLIVSDPNIIEEILVEKADAFGRDPATRRSFAPVIGETSLFLAEGAEWRWQRRAVAPIFRHEMLLSFVPIFAAMAQRQVDRWRTIQGAVPVDAAAAMTLTTFEIIVEAMLGGSASLDAERYSRALTDNFDTIPWHILYVMFSIPDWMPYPHRRRAMQSRDFLHWDIRRIVESRRSVQSSRLDLLDLLLAARDHETRRGMSDDEIVTNLLTFITAGHETTAVALTWTLWLLAKDQATQQRVFEEVRAVARHQMLDVTHVEGLSFCRQVIQEAMRLFPPAAGIARISKKAMEIGGMQIPARTRIHIPVFALHRNVDLWDNPNAFDPDRFAADQLKSRPRYAFLPFGAGPRVCIGAGFAMIEAAVILATLVRAFCFQPLAGHRPRPTAKVTLRPIGGMPLLITNR
ncbi:MAG TPA: cytochrome P450 [Pseudolabrys sp.]|nr:cytochrome P450 [Pseudolabrys sp.]